GPRRARDHKAAQRRVPRQGCGDRRALVRGGRALRRDGGGGRDLPGVRGHARRGTRRARRPPPRRDGPRGGLRSERDGRDAAKRHGADEWL
ncbi:MAG: Metal-dependent hydrolase YbeY, involved in rRNA and/or ribosome maturation and assembly, partial [uncultured Rubrobacteraceae bacterium]